jgi:hypothetical protein
MMLLSMPTMLLPTVLLPAVMLLATMLARIAAITGRIWRWWHVVHASTLEVDKYPALVLLGAVLQTQLSADLLYTWFDLLNVVRAVIAFADNDMQMGLATLARALDALLQHVLSFFNEQAVQVDGVAVNTALSIVGAEDIVPRLSVVLFHLGSVLLALLRQLVGTSAVTGLVGLVGAIEA